ncbi:fimbrial protein [Klebsiella quasipneumoniae]|uniref:fimbrial protein n=1 Tax=Klebsiella quasipneumoniae TaxID=1463165 RepID=UPI00294A256F|nr:fimbrial protein [Klebsiella quasipneumoniae]MDV5432727.1 fimbrial protein [Klebsiella quasipneumoniae]MDZ2013527.1 fimbrial protein [Klebsiella quasipneumoniae]HBR1265140.1 fimbrial protein [Klebsiella quasipneumoniae subsp. quasipneumoniae]
MKKIFFLAFSLLLSCQAFANCKYNGSTNSVRIAISPKILADTTLPVGSVLYVKSVGVSSMRTFYGCDVTSASPDVYRVALGTRSEIPGVTGIQGKPVYETGIDGIGFQISDAISGTASRPVAATGGTVPLTQTATSGVNQMTIWLIKTKPTIDTSTTGADRTAITFAAGVSTQVNTLSSNAVLLRVNFDLGPVSYRASSCNLNLRGGNPIKLKNITLTKLKGVSPGTATGQQQEIVLDMNCPASSIGTNYMYWFNPIGGTSSVDGVLPNMIPTSNGGAKDVGLIIKKGNSAVRFYDYSSYTLNNVKASQQINLSADYYRFSSDISQGNVQGLIEVVLQEQ